MAEKPQKRRMSDFGSDEPSMRSLKSAVAYMKRMHVENEREHNRICSANRKLLDKANKENSTMKKQRVELDDKVRRTEYKLSILTLEAGHMKEELERLSRVEQRVQELEEALAVSPDANLRLKIKILLVKYHPDKQHSETLPLDSETITRDLVELLEA